MEKQITTNASSENQLILKCTQGLLTREDIPEDVYKMYMRTILGGIPFEYTFKLFDGELKITFIEIPFALADRYQKVCNKININTNFQIAAKLALLMYTKELSIGTKKYTGIGDVKESWLSSDTDYSEVSKDIEQEYLKHFGELNESVHRVLPVLWSVFNSLLTFLVKDGLPTSF